MLASFQVSNVCPSHSWALAAFHGAVGSIVAAMLSSAAISFASSTSEATFAGGIVPV